MTPHERSSQLTIITWFFPIYIQAHKAFLAARTIFQKSYGSPDDALALTSFTTPSAVVFIFDQRHIDQSTLTTIRTCARQYGGRVPDPKDGRSDPCNQLHDEAIVTLCEWWIERTGEQKHSSPP